MLKQGSGANMQDSAGITPLMYAAELGSVDAMKLLLDNGAVVNLRNTNGATALMWSVTDGQKVRPLLERHADVNAVSKSGRTALLLAARSDGSADIVRRLIAAGADVKTVDGARVTALLAATLGDDIETISREHWEEQAEEAG